MRTVEKIQDRFPTRPILEAVDLPPATWYYHQNGVMTDEKKYGHLRETFEEIIRENPGYGSRKIKVELQENHGVKMDRRVILRLLDRWNLKLLQTARKGQKSGYRRAIEEAGDQTNLIKNKEEVELFDALCTDFTQVKYASGTKSAMLIVILGYRLKMIWGWAVEKTRSADIALDAWDQCRKKFDRLGIDCEGMIIHHDRDSVFTGNEWADRLFLEDGLRPSYSSNGAKENCVIESFNGHFKGDAGSLFCEAPSLKALREQIKKQVKYWNDKRRHASLGYMSPRQFLESNSNGERKRK